MRVMLKKPHAAVKSQITTLKSFKFTQTRKILLAAEGEGRNAVYAASIGWEVFAYDFSEFGYKKAMKLATEKKSL